MFFKLRLRMGSREGEPLHGLWDSEFRGASFAFCSSSRVSWSVFPQQCTAGEGELGASHWGSARAALSSLLFLGPVDASSLLFPPPSCSAPLLETTLCLVWLAWPLSPEPQLPTQAR